MFPRLWPFKCREGFAEALGTCDQLGGRDVKRLFQNTLPRKDTRHEPFELLRFAGGRINLLRGGAESVSSHTSQWASPWHSRVTVYRDDWNSKQGARNEMWTWKLLWAQWSQRLNISFSPSFVCFCFAGGHRRRLPEGVAVPLRRERLITFMTCSAALSDELLRDKSIHQRREISTRTSSSDFNVELIKRMWTSCMSFWLICAVWTINYTTAFCLFSLRSRFRFGRREQSCLRLFQLTLQSWQLFTSYVLNQPAEHNAAVKLLNLCVNNTAALINYKWDADQE